MSDLGLAYPNLLGKKGYVVVVVVVRLGIDGFSGDDCGFEQSNLGKRYGFISLPLFLILKYSCI